MKSSLNRSSVAEYDSNDSDFSVKVMEKTADGMDSRQESEVDRLFEK